MKRARRADLVLEDRQHRNLVALDLAVGVQRGLDKNHDEEHGDQPED